MYSKTILLLLSIISIASCTRFDWYDPSTYMEGAYNMVTGNAHTWDTEFKSKVHEALLDSSESQWGKNEFQFKKGSRSALLAQIRKQIEDDAR